MSHQPAGTPTRKALTVTAAIRCGLISQGYIPYMASDSDGSAVAHLKLRLRELRHAAGMTIEATAGRLLTASSTVGRSETGDRVPTPRNVRDLCRLYGADDEETAELVAIAKAARRYGLKSKRE